MPVAAVFVDIVMALLLDDLALRYIEDPRGSVTDITLSLGFSQPSAFTRAFKRWTGVSPSDHRTRLPIARSR